MVLESPFYFYKDIEYYDIYLFYRDVIIYDNKIIYTLTKKNNQLNKHYKDYYFYEYDHKKDNIYNNTIFEQIDIMTSYNF